MQKIIVVHPSAFISAGTDFKFTQRIYLGFQPSKVIVHNIAWTDVDINGLEGVFFLKSNLISDEYLCSINIGDYNTNLSISHNLSNFIDGGIYEFSLHAYDNSYFTPGANSLISITLEFIA